MCIYTYIHTYIHTYVCIYVYMYLYIQTYIYTPNSASNVSTIQSCMCEYVHTYTHVHMPRKIYTCVLPILDEDLNGHTRTHHGVIVFRLSDIWT